MKTLPQQLLAEALGTFALVFIGAGSVTVLGFNGPSPEALVGIALAHGLVLAAMISSFGHISGGHFNPAVTAGAWVVGKIETARALTYLVAQVAGAVVGAAVLRLALPEQIWRQTSLGATLVGHRFGITNPKALVIEAVLTFILVLTVFATAVDDRGVFRTVAGLPIGFVFAVGILAGGALTGGSMNPARTIGPAVVSGTWSDIWVFLIGPLGGGVLAAAVYWFAYLRGRQVRVPREETPIGGRPEERPFGDRKPNDGE